MGCVAVNELSAIDQWAGALLARLSPAGRRAAIREIARELRRCQQTRIKAQKNPDGRAFEPRKMKVGDKNLRDKPGRVKRTAMFVKLRTTRHLRADVDAQALAIGFANRAARIARVHQFGQSERISAVGPEYRYPVRTLLGFTENDQDLIRDLLLKHVAR